MAKIEIYQVDAFTDAKFGGNPAAVCLLEEGVSDEWMQQIAAEMNLSETAFLLPKQNAFGLRWFTPAAEVELCGHATLASAHILWAIGALAPKATAKFDTLSGRLTCKKKQNWIEMDFPALPAEETTPPDGLLQALGIENPVYVGKNLMDYLIEIDDEEQLKQLSPDFNSLAKVQTRGTIITAKSTHPACDFVSRFFAPTLGINEDPVTGSAHCCLSEYWGEKLETDTLIAHQASKRGGWVKIKRNQGRVHLSGQAVTVLQGTLV
ncbi:PhzF family phenazine biosynthesis protein [bacterium]|nr:PhzF family phenazine biosynthesis protein [bacterium]